MPIGNRMNYVENLSIFFSLLLLKGTFEHMSTFDRHNLFEKSFIIDAGS